MKHSRRSHHGFTMIELMIVVAILGIISAIAIPTFTLIMRRSKTAEATANLGAMFKSASSYYSAERGSQDLGGTVTGYCTVPDDDMRVDGTTTVFDPDANKHKVSAGPNLKALGFSIADFVYFAYGLVEGNGGAGACDNDSSDSSVYTFIARGDLDSDGVESRFELATGSDSSNILYHARGMYVVNELE
jgi:prepilin-type N-terminal cleavage/methylation domain-containing protein